MLSPGEFIIRASVAKKHRRALEMMNGGVAIGHADPPPMGLSPDGNRFHRGGVVYRADGGPIDPYAGVDDAFSEPGTSAEHIGLQVKVARNRLEGSSGDPNSPGYVRRQLALSKLSEGIDKSRPGDELKDHGGKLYQGLLSADANAQESTRLSTSYNPLTVIDRALSGSVLGGLASSVLSTRPLGSSLYGADPDPAIQEGDEQRRRRSLSDREKQVINVNESGVDVGPSELARTKRRAEVVAAGAARNLDLYNKSNAAVSPGLGLTGGRTRRTRPVTQGRQLRRITDASSRPPIARIRPPPPAP